MILHLRCALATATLVAAVAPAAAQTAVDRLPTAGGLREAAPDPGSAGPGFAITAAPATPRPVVATDRPVTVGAIQLMGLRAMSPADFAELLADYSGREMMPADLQQLANRIAGLLRDRGYVFASAQLPPQTVAAGVVRVDVDEGALSAVRVTGGTNAAVEAALAPLASGDPVTLDQLERRLLIAGDLPGVRIADTSYVREEGAGVLVVTIVETPVTGYVRVNNHGTRTVGPVQMQLTADAAGLLGSDDHVTVNGIITPLEPEEFGYGQLRYATRIARGGTELALTGAYSYNRPGAYLRDYDLSGSSWYTSLGLLHPLLRRRDASFWLQASLDMRGMNRRLGGARYQSDRLTVLRLGFYANSAFLGGRIQAQATLSQGLDALGATRAGDPYASRADADGTFTAATFWAEWTGGIVPRTSVRLATQVQFASDPLLVSEEIGLGGPYFLRGYDYSERIGDMGVLGLAELRYDLNDEARTSRAQLYTFVDGGMVDSLRAGNGGGSLMSAGGGVRADVSRTLGVDVQLAVPLSGARYDDGDANPELLFNLSSRF